jgi:hypothetical protein
MSGLLIVVTAGLVGLGIGVLAAPLVKYLRRWEQRGRAECRALAEGKRMRRGGLMLWTLCLGLIVVAVAGWCIGEGLIVYPEDLPAWTSMSVKTLLVNSVAPATDTAWGELLDDLERQGIGTVQGDCIVLQQGQMVEFITVLQPTCERAKRAAVVAEAAFGEVVAEQDKALEEARQAHDRAVEEETDKRNGVEGDGEGQTQRTQRH